MTDMMEVTITKRLFLILTVLLCVCLPAWAEEAGQETDPGIISWEDASSASDENAPSASEAGQEIPSPSEEEPAASGEDTDEDEAETPSEAEHTAQHQTREVLQSESDCISIGSPDAHYVKRVYDLYCDDCQRVITANCRTEEVNEPHAFEIQSRTAATCTAAGEITYHCVQCGDFVTETEPMTEHDWSPWDEASGTRTCAVCGKEESRNDSSAQEEPAAEPTENPPQDDFPLPQHTDAHETRELLHDQPIYQSLGSPDGHKVIRQYDLVCLDCNQVIQEAYRTEETVEAHPFQVVSGTASTCTEAGQEAVHCPLCGDDYVLDRPLKEHEWGEWVDISTPSDEPVCMRKQTFVRRCAVCGLEEISVSEAPGHQWEAVSYTEATCDEDGEAVRRCMVCGLEETIILPAYGHTYMLLDGDASGRYVCVICGEAKEPSQGQTTQTRMYYNNTVTSFGPTTRELIGGSVWNRVTPVDLSQEGVFTYPLVASNQYTVGTATLVNGQDSQEIQYKLNSSKINVHSESLVVYPSLEALKTGDHAVSFDFNKPIDLKGCFGQDAHVIVAITLKADYDANSTGVRRFSADQNWIDQMMAMIK